MDLPHIGISCIEDLLDESIDEFSDLIRRDGLKVKSEARPEEGAAAGLEWLLPTAIFVFIGKSYFDAFLKEAGKEHYHLLKKALAKLTARWTGPAAPTVRVYFSKGKAESSIPRYSLLYSVMAQLTGRMSVKLLIQGSFTAEECNRAVNCFLEFLESFHDGTLDPASVKGLAQAKPIGRMLLLAFDAETNTLEVVDPIPKQIRKQRSSE